MTELPVASRIVIRALVVFGLILPVLAPCPAAAQDVIIRDSETAQMLRDARRIRGLRVTVEVRFLTADGEFLERIGVDFSGSVSGQVTRRDQAVENAKLILEVFKVRIEGNPPRRSMARTGRQTVSTDASGRFRLSLRNLIDAKSRAEILSGDVASLVVEATGKNGKKVDLVQLRGETNLGGLIP